MRVEECLVGASDQGSELSFSSLPVDVLLHILRYLSVYDILYLRQASKSMYTLTRLHAVWYHAMLSEVLPLNIPIPGLYSRDIASLSASDLEHMIVRALRLRKNWLSPSPMTRNRTEIVPLPEEELRDTLRSAVVRFLPGRGNRYLLTVTGHTNFPRRRYTVQCWDLEAHDGPVCVAIRRFTEIVSVAVNCDPTAAGVLSVTCKVEGNETVQPATFIHGLDLASTNHNPEYAFKYLNHFSGCRRLHIFNGSLLVGTNESEAVRVWDVNTGKILFELRDNATIQPSVCVNAVFLENTNFLILFRTISLEIYLLPHAPSSTASQSSSPPLISPNTNFQIVNPVALYKWQWRIDSVSVSFQTESKRRYASQLNPLSSEKSASNGKDKIYEPTAMHLFMRFDSWFPWPVNLLHHFVLYPNPSYVPTPHPTLTSNSSPESPTSDSPLSPNESARTHVVFPSSLNPLTDLPYLAAAHQIPTLVSSISSTVRLFAPSDMVLGEWGTALWLDTQTDMWGVSGELGQRIAGRVMVPSSFDGITPANTQVNEGGGTNADASYGNQNLNDNPPSTLATGFASATRQVPPAQTASMTFGIRDPGTIRKQQEDSGEAATVAGVTVTGAERGATDEWMHLGLDEEGGRVVVGRNGGRVEVWEYA
ncbi:hypothetical protein NEOLEDRAFT_1133717 [Neolentinus lepideus HHB14362 ss-1]|uniref:F-box domain-containing protein n=1 Tax=Neolentinus lepideus HHB14362 ss-1 TaxID=1314782 RepID=A0A165SLJ8_9AGAM|nr:hypothetical protein NEOLEDRAFT_1133717 [Neolentinus lepideus HHB14362 ss-1]